jgi:hypothetical protein
VVIRLEKCADDREDYYCKNGDHNARARLLVGLICVTARGTLVAYHDHAFKAPTTGFMIAAVTAEQAISGESAREAYLPSESIENLEG